MDFGKRDGLALREFSKRLAEISVYRNERPILRLLELLVDHSGIKLATLWKVVEDGSIACSIERAGYRPDPEKEPTEYLCMTKGSHIELFLDKKPFDDFEPWFINDLSKLPIDPVFNTPKRLNELGLTSAFMIPLDVDSGAFERYFLNIYFEKKDVDLEDEANAIQAINFKTSAIVMSSFDILRTEVSKRLQTASSESVGEIETFFASVVEKVLPIAVPAKRYFLFTKDDVSKNSYWEYCNVDGQSFFSDADVAKVNSMLSQLELDEPMSGWDCSERRFSRIFGDYSSILIVPIKSMVEHVHAAGFLVLCDALHKNGKREFDVEIVKPFSKEQAILVSEISDRCGSLFDIYLHEHRRQNMTNVLAHEILAPADYIFFTSSRLLRKERSLTRRERGELENVHNTAGLQVSVCQGIFLSNQNRARTFREKYNPTKLPVHKSFVEWRKFLHPTCTNYGLDFDRIKIDVTMPEIHIDVRALQVVFLNLCMNALKYAKDAPPDEGAFSLNVKSRFLHNENLTDRLRKLERPSGVLNSGYFILSFEDTGIGVPVQHAEKIFEEYFRVENEATSFRSGMGLGLSMVRDIVRDHCGDVWLSKSHSPTVFQVALPMFLQFETDSVIFSAKGSK